MSRHPSGPARLFEDDREARRPSARVPPDVQRPIALLGVGIEGLLIFSGAEIGFRLPRRPAFLLPDSFVMNDAVRFVRAHPSQPQPLLVEIIESLLKVCFRHVAARLPCVTRLLFPKRRVPLCPAARLPAQAFQTETLLVEIVKDCLKLRL